jgi:energy-coupling factor transport system ATP-binding protein
VLLIARGRLIADGTPDEMLGGGWYFATETARVTGGLAVTPEQGAELLRALSRAGEGAR